MNKLELIAALAEEEGLTQEKAKEIVNAFFGEIESAMIEGERIELRGFGSFKMKDYDGYQGRNPKSGELIQIAPKRLPFFKVGKELKERVDL
ncbi:HU family DNA-binding protein [Desulfatiglans anilini]|uniref:HU family DNA-binding protein n=1 Tax=Desulfatiglans anilini TaxID=90728 RepID=UPI000402C358|nr:HU family DNA-binding protein [Desulfatiglans anilini]